jgi:D-alanyl-D-alanine carboxypeptidase
MKKYFILLFLLPAIVKSYSQDFDTNKLDAYFEALEVSNKFMGSVALLKEGKIVYTKHVGFSDVESKIKPSKNTKYKIGSISKTFTSTLILMAVEEQRLALSTTIENYFPSITNSEIIAISNLLNHRSGIHNFTDDVKDYIKYNTTPKTEKEMIQIIAKSGSDFEPDSKAQYSNSNYVLLSYILEKVYSKPYDEILDEKIIQPLGLKDTYFGSKSDMKNNESHSYVYQEKWMKQPETDISIPMGAGGIVSTPSDLTLFAHALFTNKLIAETNLNKMKTITDKYGMGLFQMPFYDKIGFGHTGGIDGFSAVLGYFEKENVSFAITSNGANYVINEISIALLSSIFNKPFSVPSFDLYEVESKDLNKYLGIYASESFPLKITISKSGNVLMAQATGQSSFALVATEKDKFKFDRAGIVMEFDPDKNQMTLKQGGTVNVLTKE